MAPNTNVQYDPISTRRLQLLQVAMYTQQSMGAEQAANAASRAHLRSFEQPTYRQRPRSDSH